MASGFSVRVYGTLDQQPPYLAVNGNLASVQATYPTTQTLLAGFPNEGGNFFNISGGVKMAAGVICYGVIELPATGLNVHSTKYVTQQNVTALSALRNA